MTEQKIPYAILFLSVAALLLAGSILADQYLKPSLPQDPTQLENPTDPPPTEPPFTIDSIRTETFYDIPSGSAAYDAACYMLYYDIMDAENGLFFPDRVVTQAECIDALERLTGKELPDPEKPAAYVNRGTLAVMLCNAARELGISTQSTLESLPYFDAAQISKNNYAAILWATEKGLFRSFVGNEMLETTVVSRLQLAQSLIALQSYNPDDQLSPEIFQATPVRNNDSLSLMNHADIQAHIDSIAQEYGAVGLQVAVIENGVVTDTYVYGWATKNSAKMTAEHKQRIASISKVIVGITAQLLREDGIITLDDDINQYLKFTVRNPQYPDVPITFRMLLSHTSSIYHTSEAYTYSAAKTYLAKKHYTQFAPGDMEGWTYNNYAFSILGMTLELAANKTADTILNEKLFSKMDIDAAFGSGDIKNTNKLITLYRNDGSIGRTIAVQTDQHSSKTPGDNGRFFAGGFTSSAKDVAKLIAMLAGDGIYEGVRLMDAQSVEIMETPFSETAVPGGSYQAYPMRYWENLYNRDKIYFHTGSAYGAFNCASYDPETGDGIVVLTTGASDKKDDYGIYKVCADINSYIYNAID